MTDQSKKVYICRCEEVTLEEIEQAIMEGATTLSGIKKRTTAGMGLCQGRTCHKLISKILAVQSEGDQLTPPKPRPPVRPVIIDALIEEDYYEK